MGPRRHLVVAALATLSLAVGLGVAGSHPVTARTVVPYSPGPDSAALDLSQVPEADATPRVEPAKAGSRPNVIVILTDDQRVGTVAGMPFTASYLRDRGVEFTNAHSPTSTCCPARSTLLTGNHAPTTGVWTNWQPYGGWAAFHHLEQSTLALSLQESGYRTGLVGKYLNGYADPKAREAATGDADYIPPGWDEWHTFGVPVSVTDPEVIRLSDQGYYDYWLMSRGDRDTEPKYSYYGGKPRDYSTDVLGAEAVDVIESTPADQPLFLLYTPYGPHAPSTPAPRHARAKVDVAEVPGFANAEGKPPWITAGQTVRPGEGRSLERRNMRALLSVDDNVRAILDALEREGRLRNSLVIFASDNGLAWGEFNLIETKNYPYTTPIPLVMRWDAAPSGSPLAGGGRRDDRIVSLADVTATIASVTGTDMPGIEDGLDLSTRAEERKELLIAAWRNRGSRNPLPAYCGIRTDRWLYVHYRGGIEEGYDLVRDPHLLRNLFPNFDADDGLMKPDVVSRLRAQTRELCDPAPPGFSWDSEGG